MSKKQVNKSIAIKEGVWGALRDISKYAPIWKQILSGVEAYDKNLREQMLQKYLEQLEVKIKNIEESWNKKAEEYFNTEEGKTIFYKASQSALNAEYIDKQELFINALIAAPLSNNPEDEKLRFIDLIRQLSRVTLNVLSVVYRLYDKEPSQVNIDRVVSEANKTFGYLPELTDSALHEINNLGIFSNITGWHRVEDRITESSSYSSGVMAYTSYTKRFVEFILMKNKLNTVD